MNTNEEIEKILDILSEIRINNTTDEFQIHHEIKKALLDYGIKFIHEYKILTRKRFDFWIDGIVLEVKKRRPGKLALLKQLDRYTKTKEVKAIKLAMKEHKRWFRELKKLDTIIDKLLFLKSLPWIGDITKYHLARNLGIDVAKPDRHMMRLAGKFGYDGDVMCMCNDVSKQVGDRIGTVDVVLWRYCNLNPDYRLELKEK